jgi:hypothetical protein
METGAFSPSLDRVWVVAEALEVTMHELFEDAEPPEPHKPAKPGADSKHRRRSA